MEFLGHNHQNNKDSNNNKIMTISINNTHINKDMNINNDTIINNKQQSLVEPNKLFNQDNSGSGNNKEDLETMDVEILDTAEDEKEKMDIIEDTAKEKEEEFEEFEEEEIIIQQSIKYNDEIFKKLWSNKDINENIWKYVKERSNRNKNKLVLKYQQTHSIEWLIKNEYWELLKYRVKLHDPITFNEQSFKLITKVFEKIKDDQEFWNSFYQQYKSTLLNCLDDAVKFNNLVAVKSIIENLDAPIQYQPDIQYKAISTGNVELLQYLHKIGIDDELNTILVLDYAQQSSNVSNMIRYLNNKEYISKDKKLIEMLKEKNKDDKEVEEEEEEETGNLKLTTSTTTTSVTTITTPNNQSLSTTSKSANNEREYTDKELPFLQGYKEFVNIVNKIPESPNILTEEDILIFESQNEVKVILPDSQLILDNIKSKTIFYKLDYDLQLKFIRQTQKPKVSFLEDLVKCFNPWKDQSLTSKDIINYVNIMQRILKLEALLPLRGTHTISLLNLDDSLFKLCKKFDKDSKDNIKPKLKLPNREELMAMLYNQWVKPMEATLFYQKNSVYYYTIIKGNSKEAEQLRFKEVKQSVNYLEKAQSLFEYSFRNADIEQLDLFLKIYRLNNSFSFLYDQFLNEKFKIDQFLFIDIDNKIKELEDKIKKSNNSNNSNSSNNNNNSNNNSPNNNINGGSNNKNNVQVNENIPMDTKDDNSTSKTSTTSTSTTTVIENGNNDNINIVASVNNLKRNKMEFIKKILSTKEFTQRTAIQKELEKRKEFKLLEALVIGNQSFSKSSTNWISLSIKENNFEFLEFCIQNDIKLQESEIDEIVKLSNTNYNALLTLLNSSKFNINPFIRKFIESSIDNGRLDLFELFANRYPLYFRSNEILVRAVSNNQNSIISFIMDNNLLLTQKPNDQLNSNNNHESSTDITSTSTSTSTLNINRPKIKIPVSNYLLTQKTKDQLKRYNVEYPILKNLTIPLNNPIYQSIKTNNLQALQDEFKSLAVNQIKDYIDSNLMCSLGIVGNLDSIKLLFELSGEGNDNISGFELDVFKVFQLVHNLLIHNNIDAATWVIEFINSKKSYTTSLVNLLYNKTSVLYDLSSLEFFCQLIEKFILSKDPNNFKPINELFKNLFSRGLVHCIKFMLERYQSKDLLKLQIQDNSLIKKAFTNGKNQFYGFQNQMSIKSCYYDHYYIFNKQFRKQQQQEKDNNSNISKRKREDFEDVNNNKFLK